MVLLMMFGVADVGVVGGGVVGVHGVGVVWCC